MFLFKKFIPVVLILTILLSVSAVSAYDDVGVTDNLIVTNTGNLTELNFLIQNSNGTLTLDKNYAYVIGDPVDGIVINRDNFILDGNGYTIDGQSQSRIFQINSKHVIIKNTNFINGFSNVTGGTILVGENNSLYISDSNFTGSVSNGFAGAVRAYGNLIVYNCNFIDNKAVTSAGAIGGGDLNYIGVFNSYFENNSAKLYGGAICGRYSNSTISECNFVNNIAEEYGGAVCTANILNIVNSTFTDNMALIAGGAVNGAKSTDLNIINSIFVGNAAPEAGAIRIGADSSMVISDSVFIDNYAFTSRILRINNNSFLISYNNTFIDSSNETSTVEGFDAFIINEGTIYFEGSKTDFNKQLYVYNYGMITSPTNIYVLNNQTVYVQEGERIYLTATLETDTLPVSRGDLYFYSGNGIYISKWDENINCFVANYTVGINKIETVTAKYLGANNTACYNAALFKEDYKLYADDLTKFYKGNESFVAYLTDVDGNVLEGKTINLYINGREYKRITDEKGMISLAINLAAGNYTIFVNYGNLTQMRKITVLSTVVGSDIVKYFRNGTQYSARFFDTEGNVLKNTAVQFNINGIFYTRTTNDEGIAILNINLSPAEYILTAINPVNGEMSSNYIKVLPIITGEDLYMSFKDGSKYEVRLVDGQGNPVAGATITLNILGVFYHKITDNNGIARLTINLNPGEYIITASYGGAATSNHIYVSLTKSVLAFNKVQNVNKQKPYPIIYLNKNGNYLINEKVVVSVDGTDYKLTTDNEGTAYLNLNLKEGIHVISTTNPVDGTNSSTLLTIENEKPYAYWVWASDIYDLDLAKLKSLGTTDLLVNYYVFERYGEKATIDWISQANNYGIRIHIYMQCFWDGEWIAPQNKDGTLKYDLYDAIINEALYYASIPGVCGIHLDYLRYGGTAHLYVNPEKSINYLTSELVKAVKNQHPDMVISAAIMPEPDMAMYYYGQDIGYLSKYLDIIIPMVYKGNYQQDRQWIKDTADYYVSHSNGAQVWIGLQGYVSDYDETILTVPELTADAQAALDAKADGVVIFRYTYAPLIDTKTLNY